MAPTTLERGSCRLARTFYDVTWTYLAAIDDARIPTR